MTDKNVRHLTSEEYVNSGGEHCPVCRSVYISATSKRANVYESAIYRKMICADCGATWEEEFEITGYWRLKLGGKKE